MPRYLSRKNERFFPQVRRQEYRVQSPKSIAYNCISFAAGRTDRRWWPPGGAEPGEDFWPAGVPAEETLDAFAAAFGTIGYTPCTGPEQEPGFEKIAVYALASGAPTHAARQLPSGAWLSKVGDLQDIEHQTLAALEGGDYGKAVLFLRRPRQEG